MANQPTKESHPETGKSGTWDYSIDMPFNTTVKIFEKLKKLVLHNLFEICFGRGWSSRIVQYLSLCQFLSDFPDRQV